MFDVACERLAEAILSFIDQTGDSFISAQTEEPSRTQ